MRWRGGRSTYRSAREPIDPSRYRVGRIGDKAARDFVVRHHYSRSYPAAIAAYGLFERIGAHQEELAGVAVFSVCMQPRAADAYGAGGLPFAELGRFVLLDRVPGNGETWFLSRALSAFAADKAGPDGRPAYALCLAYSDPVPRTDAAGRRIFCGHYGGIYAASSAIYLGRGCARSHWLTREGAVVSQRALSKLRNGERGASYAYEFLVANGAPRIAVGETGRAYVSRALAEGPFRRLRHGGNHAYALTFGTHAVRKAVRARMDRGLQSPRSPDAAAA